jgi:hypothetical protein
MKQIICDKCKKVDSHCSEITCKKAFVNYGNYVSAHIDLCDNCRRELANLIKDWLTSEKNENEKQ